MKTVMELQTPDLKQIAEAASEIWGWILGLCVAIGSIAGFFRKKVVKVIKAIWNWMKAAALLPKTLADIQAGLTVDGVTLQQRMALIGDELAWLKEVYVMTSAMMRAKLDMSNSALMQFDKRGGFMWGNKTLLMFVGRELPRLIGSNWRNMIAIPDREIVYEGWQNSVKDGTDFETRFRLLTDGAEQWVRFETVCNKDDLGNVVGFFGKIRSDEDPR